MTAASATDEGPLPDWFPDDPKEVKFLTHGEAIELIAMARRGVARPAVPALDVERLARALHRVLGSSLDNPYTMQDAQNIAREYALQEQPE